MGTKWHSCRHLDEMLTFDGALWCSPAIDPGLFPLKWPPTPPRRTPASVVARLSGRPRRHRFRRFIRARTRPRSDARPPRGTRSSSGRIGHRTPIQRAGLVLDRVTTGGFYGSHATGGPSAEPEPGWSLGTSWALLARDASEKKKIVCTIQQFIVSKSFKYNMRLQSQNPAKTRGNSD